MLLKHNWDFSPENLVAKAFVLGYCMFRQLIFVTFKSQTNSQNVVYLLEIVAGLIVGKLWLSEFLAPRTKAAPTSFTLSSETVSSTNAISLTEKFTPFSDRRFHWRFSIDLRKRWSLHYKHIFRFVFSENTLSFLHLRRHFNTCNLIAPDGNTWKIRLHNVET
jgi:hypothetical protein